MNFYRCLICGEVYMGDEKPSNCPYCGSKGKYLVPAEKWVDENKDLGRLSDISRKNLERALHLEVNNSPFYRDAMGRTGDIELQGVFKYLSKIEGEHASTIKKILNCQLPQSEIDYATAKENDKESLREAHRREVEASAFYKKAADEAGEDRVKRVFTALSEIEGDHINLEAERLKTADNIQR